VTGEPEQTVVTGALIVIETGKTASTVRVIMLDVAGFPAGQPMSDVRMQDTTSALVGMYVNVGELVPAFVPLTFHW